MTWGCVAFFKLVETCGWVDFPVYFLTCVSLSTSVHLSEGPWWFPHSCPGGKHSLRVMNFRIALTIISITRNHTHHEADENLLTIISISDMECQHCSFLILILMVNIAPGA